MASQEISGHTALAAVPAVDDLFVLVDVSDTTDAPSGTTKKIVRTNALGQSVNAQTGTTYTVLTSDFFKLVTHTNAAAIAVTLPQAGVNFPAGWFCFVQNRGAGAVTITPTTSTIDGAASLILNQNEGVLIVSDGTNYFTMRGKSAGGVAPGDHNHTSGAGDGGLLSGAGIDTFLEFDEVVAPSTPASAKVRLYVKADGKIYIKDDAGTETDLTTGGGGGASDDFETWREMITYAQTGGTTYDQVGMAIPDVVGTKTNNNDATAPFVKHTTLANIGANGGIDNPGTQDTDSDWKSILYALFKTDADISSIRIAFGWTQAVDPDSQPTNNMALIWYATDLHGTAFWRCTNRNNAGTETETVTSLAVATGTAYRFKIDWSDKSQIVYSYHNGSAWVVLATHTTNLPANDTMAWLMMCSALAASARAISISFVKLLVRLVT